jgi:NAD(P)-dependent dehydrogenase (short-subunit alcohol dehydrogenase family)
VTADLLAKNGFFVYAGARKEKDLADLSALKNVQGIRLDVTVQAEIDAAVQTVKDGGRGLYGLINNAGVVVLAPLIEVPENDLAFQLDVNVMGPYRVTKAFVPMIIESKGRISTTGSLSGTATWGFGGPYTMSKFAVEAFTDVLALEMEGFGVTVSVVEPGNYKSKIMATMKERLVESGYTAEGSLFEDKMSRLLKQPLDRANLKDPGEVADAFLHFLTSENPKRRYMVVPNQGEAAFTLNAAFTRLVQQNQDQEYTYSREELIAMLDAALDKAPPLSSPQK